MLLFVTVVQRPASRKWQKPRVKPEIPGFSRVFRVLPALDAGDRRGSLPGLPYCCSAGLTLATVVGEPHCCSVVTVNTSNTVQLPTLNSSNTDGIPLGPLQGATPPGRPAFPVPVLPNQPRRQRELPATLSGSSASRTRPNRGPQTRSARQRLVMLCCP